MQGRFDIAVLGSGASGLAAACSLAGAGRSVAVIAGPDCQAESSLCDWSPFDLAELPGLSKAILVKAGAASLKEIRYHGQSDVASVSQKLGKASAWGFSPGEPAGCLERQAKKAGVKFIRSSGGVQFEVADDAVVFSQPKPVRADCLIITAGLPADYADRLAIAGIAAPTSRMSVAGVDLGGLSPAVLKKVAGALHVVRMSDSGRLGIMFAVGKILHVRSIVDSSNTQQAEETLAAVLGLLKARNILPAGAAGRLAVKFWHPPAGQAIEIETHHNKRCLLAGPAGGFADCVTGQTLLPSIRSTVMAAKIAKEAIAGNQLQETLVRFNSAWRKELADRIRQPSTSLQMLMPLLFVNAKVRLRISDMILTGRQI